MKITELRLQNFKRFTDLTITEIPRDTRLVLLIGTNGSGKSSVFDAFALLGKQSKENLENKESSYDKLSNYYAKGEKRSTIDFQYVYQEKENIINLNYDGDGTSVILSWGDTLLPKTAFYGRSSLRQTPQLTKTSIGQNGINIEKDEDSPALFILRDNRFENDIDNITRQILADVFKEGGINTTEIRNRYINPINLGLDNIFKDTKQTLQLISLSPPLEGKPAELIFEKGNTRFHYDLLSSGEKEILNILLNLLSRRRYFQDTIYFIDEMDLHLNTALQYSLLQEITENWLPDNCQLWTASHSIGFIDYAQNAEHAVVIDFDDLNFDQPQVLVPNPKDNREVYEIAVSKDMVGRIFDSMNLFFVENQDAQIYNSIGLKNKIFIPEDGKNAVYHKVRGTKFKGIIDRDYLTEEEIKEIRSTYSKLLILDYYSIENYLYHPDNLEEYYKGTDKAFSKEKYLTNLIVEKNRVLEDLKLRLTGSRETYPFFKEIDVPKTEALKKQKKIANRYKKREENHSFAKKIAKALSSDQLEDFYPVFPMKDYAKQLPQRQNLPKSKLTQTNWFKKQIEKVLA